MRECERCGKGFRPRNGGGRHKYCSKACCDLNFASTWRPLRPCHRCGKEFPCPRGQKKYCSRECRVTGKIEVKCSVCGETFVRASKAVKCCSKSCGLELSKRTRASKSTVGKHECSWCGAWFRPKGNDRTTFCSRECAFAAQKWKGRLRRAERASAPRSYCAVCFQAIAGKRKKVCSSECAALSHRLYSRRHYYEGGRKLRYEAKRARDLRLRDAVKCRECGAKFVPAVLGTLYCSARCGKRVAKRTRRARKAGAEREAIRRQDVFDRDGWICQLCGRPTDRQSKAPQPNAPVVDHIVPLAVGGAHTFNNVQCAHFLCNSKKAAGSCGSQLRIQLRVGACKKT